MKKNKVNMEINKIKDHIDWLRSKESNRPHHISDLIDFWENKLEFLKGKLRDAK